MRSLFTRSLCTIAAASLLTACASSGAGAMEARATSAARGAAPDGGIYGAALQVALASEEAELAEALRGILSTRGDAPRIDPALVLAARDLAGRAQREDRAAVVTDPEELRLAQARAGVIAAAIQPVVVRATNWDAARRRMAEHARTLRGEAIPQRIGVGSARNDGGITLVLLQASGGVEIAPLPARIPPGATLRIEGRLLDLDTPSLVVTPPDGRPLRIPLEGDGRSFHGTVEIGARGIWTLELLGRSERGPAIAALLPLYAGMDIPDGATPIRVESEPTDVAGKERLLADEVNRLRAGRGLAPLLIDATLSRVARAYAEEIRSSGRFAHRSLISGGPGDRLRLAGYRSVRAGENLAEAPSVRQAHRSLMESPGHLANLVEPGWREAGFGVALAEQPGGAMGVIVVQIFASPSDEG